MSTFVVRSCKVKSCFVTSHEIIYLIMQMDTIDEYNIQVICVEKNGESFSQHKDEMRLYCECGQLDNGISLPLKRLVLRSWPSLLLNKWANVTSTIDEKKTQQICCLYVQSRVLNLSTLGSLLKSKQLMFSRQQSSFRYNTFIFYCYNSLLLILIPSNPCFICAKQWTFNKCHIWRYKTLFMLHGACCMVSLFRHYNGLFFCFVFFSNISIVHMLRDRKCRYTVPGPMLFYHMHVRLWGTSESYLLVNVQTREIFRDFGCLFTRMSAWN